VKLVHLFGFITKKRISTYQKLYANYDNPHIFLHPLFKVPVQCHTTLMKVISFQRSIKL